ncbi:MAG: GrpB family protein, partial [Lentisphaeria bacterium]|nr:GrpB family protein [Lentisphaeria bacterium]
MYISAIARLIAKPTVDILLEVDEKSDVDMIRQLAIECGYTVMEETTVPEYR